MARDDQLELEGRVLEAPGGGFMKVKVMGPNGHEHVVMATLSGKMREHKIRVVVGDKVKVAVSPYDLTKGRITFRDRGGN